ncbi:abortive infection bacteriophage resistance protein [Actinobacillus equuli]|nr:abortive infection bacteriophage resistance protein [Actinobacillus equuli]
MLLYTISPNSTWAKRLKELLDSYPDIQKEYMGIPQNWELDSFWDKALR